MAFSFKMKGDVTSLWEFINGFAFGLHEIKQLVQNLSGPSALPPRAGVLNKIIDFGEPGLGLFPKGLGSEC